MEAIETLPAPKEKRLKMNIFCQKHRKNEEILTILTISCSFPQIFAIENNKNQSRHTYFLPFSCLYIYYNKNFLKYQQNSLFSEHFFAKQRVLVCYCNHLGLYGLRIRLHFLMCGANSIEK